MKSLHLILAASAASFVLAPAVAQAASCDPTDITDVIELARFEDAEVTRTGDLFWLDVTPTIDPATLDEYVVGDDGVVRASAIHVRLEGGDCSVIVDSVRIKSGDQWRDLRIAGNNVFTAGYFGDRFAVPQLAVGLDLFLLQRAYCTVTVNALIYADAYPFLRPFPYPDPDC